MKAVNLKEIAPKKGDLVVYHIPQVPGGGFHVKVDSPAEAMLVIDMLAEYDKFQYQQRVKGDYANASGLLLYDGTEWLEWEDQDGESIMEKLNEEWYG